MSKGQEKRQSQAREVTSTSPKKMSRRTLLRAGATAMPVILTLQSGEALARSSNLIGAAPAGTRGEGGRALCLETSNLGRVSDSRKYDLGDPGFATVNALPDADYYPLESGRSGAPISADEFCSLGGSRKYHAGGWHQVDLPTNGIIVSSVALRSVGSRADILIHYWS
jgi:hypothetical protein